MSLKFGTSGVRGLVEEFTFHEVYKFIAAFIEHASGNAKVYLAMDRRESSHDITSKVMLALRALDREFEFHGILPTPCLANFSMSHRGLGVIVTGSHVPNDRNGIKFYLPEGETLKSDELAIESLYQNIELSEKAKAMLSCKDLVEEINKIILAPQREAEVAYTDRALNFFKKGELGKPIVIVYGHSAAGRGLIVKILQLLGCEVISKGFSDHFVAVDTENLKSLSMLKNWVLECKADFLVSTDGDSDRPLIIDDRGEVLRGDQIGMLLCLFLGVKYIAVPVSTLSSIQKIPQFEKIEFTKIGSPFVIEALHQLKKEHPDEIVAGFEANGGFLTATRIERLGRKLTPLETRDAMLPILGIISYCAETGLPLSELRKKLPEKYSYSGLIKPITASQSEWLLKDAISNPKKFAANYLEFIDSSLADFNNIDGARFMFKDESVVHLRPSGNAPEFRCYTESVNSVTATEINQKTLSRLAQEFRDAKIN